MCGSICRANQQPFYIFGQRNSSADFDINSGVEAGKVYPLSLFLEADGSLVLSPDQAVSADRLTRYGLPTYHLARVDKGDRMPGVPLHNLNANFVFHLPHRWTVGLTAVGHSGSYVRGNENNDHHAGPAAVEADQLVGDVVFDPKTGEPTGVVFHSNGAFRAGQPFLRQGTLPGYFLFNLRAEFQATRAFTFFFQLNNVLDKGYFSGGRLDTNPFSPSIYGAIGPSGWNYNSKDWQNTTYVAPGAPRALWAGVNYRFGS